MTNPIDPPLPPIPAPPSVASIVEAEERAAQFVEENACILFDPANEWCTPAIEFARWKAEDTEGLRSDQEHDTHRRHATLRIAMCCDGLYETFGHDLDAVTLRYIAECLIDHFEEVYSGESAEPNNAYFDGDDEDDIPFEAPARVLTPTPDANLFQQVDDLIRSHFGLPPKPRF